MSLCPDCKRNFPQELLSELATTDSAGLLVYALTCPLCALRTRNEMHGLPPDTLFQGTIAAEMHRKAVYHLRRTGQSDGKEAASP